MRSYAGRWFERQGGPAPPSASAPTADRRAAAAGGDGASVASGQGAPSARRAAAALRPDQPPARRQPPLRLRRPRTLARRPAPLRGIDSRRCSPTRAPRRAACRATSRSSRRRAADLSRDRAVRAAARVRRSAWTSLPLARVVERRARSTTTTRSSRPASCRRGLDRRRRSASSTSWCAASWPSSIPPRELERTESVTEVAGERFRTRGPAPARGRLARRLRRSARTAAARSRSEATRTSRGAAAAAGRGGRARRAASRPRCREADQAAAALQRGALLSVMETAGKQIEDEDLREALKESGLGTPATRAEIIENLIRRAVRRAPRQAAARDPQGAAGDRPAGRPRPDLGRADRRLGEAPEPRSSTAQATRDGFMAGIADFTPQRRRALPRPRPPTTCARQRAVLGPCPNGDGDDPREPAGLRLHLVEERARSPAAASSSGSRQKGRSISAAEARELLEKGQTSCWTGSRPGRAGRGSCSPRETRCSSSPTTAPASTRPAGAAREDRRLPEVRRRDPREQPRLRLLVVEEQEGAGLRLRHLEVDQGPPDLGPTRPAR